MLAWIFIPQFLWILVLAAIAVLVMIRVYVALSEEDEPIEERKQRIDSMLDSVNSTADLVILYGHVAAKHGVDSVETKWFKFGVTNRNLLGSEKGSALDIFDRQVELIDQVLREYDQHAKVRTKKK